MAYKCATCNKGVMIGRQHKHHPGVAGGRWKKRAPKTNRTFKANLQRVSIIVDTEKIQVKLCTRCIKRIKKDIGDNKKPFLTLAHIKLSKPPKKEAESLQIAASA